MGCYQQMNVYLLKVAASLLWLIEKQWYFYLRAGPVQNCGYDGAGLCPHL